MAYDVIKEYAKKTMKELQAIETQFTDAVKRAPNIKSFNEHLQLVKMLIAERIGKNKLVS